jgi:aerobic C4-dicarboxylate transport protein
MNLDHTPRKPLYQKLYVQVLLGIFLGVAVGYFYPKIGVDLKPLGDAFIKLIKMMIAPIIFTTVVVGIAHMGHMRDVGRVGLKALVYFEVVSTIALLIGLLVVNVTTPGAGINANPATIDTKGIQSYTAAAQHSSTLEFVMNIIPNTMVDAFAKGEILQVLLFAILFGLALAQFGERGKPVVQLIDTLSHVFFTIIGFIMKLAPIGAFGAMGFTIAKFGIGSLAALGKLYSFHYKYRLKVKK